MAFKLGKKVDFCMAYVLIYGRFDDLYARSRSLSRGNNSALNDLGNKAR